MRAGSVSPQVLVLPMSPARMSANWFLIQTPCSCVCLAQRLELPRHLSCRVWQPHELTHHEDLANGRDEHWSWEAGLGETARLERIIAVFTSRDIASPATAARDHLAATCAAGFSAAASAHVDAWRDKWEAGEVLVIGDAQAQRALRFATYHLIAAVNPVDEHVSIGARGLTGEAYRGHVFWDTEIYMLPFYIFTDPPAARALLMYRYHTLDAARRKAKAHGCDGALYAWESADTGDEVTPKTAVAPDGRLVVIRTGEREHHISADVAYAVWQVPGAQPATTPSW